MAQHRMIFRPLVEITEQEDAVGLAVDDRLQQARDAETPGDRHRIGAAAHAAPDMGVIARPVADAPLAGGITPFAHRADVDMNGDEFDRLAQIGNATGRENGVRTVLYSVVSVDVKKKQK